MTQHPCSARRPWRLAPVLPALAVAFFFSGCAFYSTKPSWPAQVHAFPDGALILAAGDEIELKFAGAPDLNTTQTVRRDGKLMLVLVGELDAAGKTPAILRQELLRLYASQIQLKEVSVFVRSPGPIYVSGAVTTDGQQQIERPITAMEAIMRAGGFDEREAEVRNVIVIRHRDGKRQGYKLNLKPALYGKGGTPFYLRPYDIVYVPRTRIVKVNQWVDQYISRMLPRIPISFTPISTE